ncbi:MAG: M48 family metalloprotease, partial [Xanthomonadales bacterium]|nr:M48 family metalloprotease [Xanthomonadales bacterium]
MQRLLLACAVLLVSLAASAQDRNATDNVTLPDMGASADSILSRKEEEEYARSLLMQMRAYNVLIEDPQVAAYFSDMGYRLVAYSERPDKAFTFVVLNEEVVNAFAAPGGVIALFSGMILTADDESEIAAVLAHEIAHITQLHLYRTLEKTKAMSIPIALAMLGLVLAGGGSGDAIQGALVGGSAALQQAQINFTRQHEAEADRIGIRTLAQAGYNPDGMAEFFEKMNRVTRSAGKGPPEYLRTHPVNVSRIAEATDRALKMPRPEAASELDFFLMQARLRALVTDAPGKTLKFFDDRRRRADISEEEAEAIEYGSAIALQQKGDYAEARKILDSLLAHRNHLAYELQLADLDLASNDENAAIERLDNLYNAFPGNHAIVMQYGRALLHTRDKDRARKAEDILRQQLLTRGDDPLLQELYAQASNISGNRIRASEAIAEAYYLRGQVSEAILQLT